MKTTKKEIEEEIEVELEEGKASNNVRIIEALIGRTFHTVNSKKDNEELSFLSDEDSYVFYHDQDCCERVYINDICGDLSDLENSPILVAEVVWREALGENAEPDRSKREVSESGTWTFYKFATIKGYVTVRWIGESNGYYSESVDFKKIKKGTV